MPLDRKRITIPMTSGHEADTDERVQSALKLLRLENCEWLDRGAIRARHGFDEIASVDGGRCIFSTGDELCVAGNDVLYAYDPIASVWRTRVGFISPWGLERRVIMRDELTFAVADQAICTNGIVGHATQIVARDSDTGETFSGISFAITNEDNQMLHAPSQRFSFHSSTTPETQGMNPRMCTSGTVRLMCVYQQGADPATAADLRAIQGSINGFSDLGAIVSADVASFGGLVFGYVHDAVAMIGTDYYAVAYIQFTTLDLVINTYHLSSTAVVSTTTIAGPVQRVALASSASGAALYVVTSDASNIKFSSYGVGGAGVLVHVSGPTNIAATTTTADPVGVAYGVIAATPALVIVWSDDGHTYSVTTTVLGAKTDSIRAIWNTFPVTRPWFAGEAAYCTLGNRMDGDPSLESALAVMDLRAGSLSADQRTPRVGAFHHIGQALSGSTVSTLGAGSSLANVATDSTGRYHYDVVAGGIAAGSDEVVLMTAPPINAISVYRGTAIIGGALVSWYDGVRTFELGTPVGMTATLVAETTGAGSLAGDYLYQIVAISHDMKGVQHIGLPGPPTATVTVAGFDNAVELTIPYTSLTNRADSDRVCDQMAILVYRDDGDGGFALTSKQFEVHPNSLFAAGTPNLIVHDLGAPLGELLYTSTGLVENVSPEGGQYVFSVGGRVQLTGCANRTVVPYSKKLSATAAGRRTAPEFNQDDFGFVLPFDDVAVAVAALDDKQVIFSTVHVYLQSGEGPDASGLGPSFGALQLFSADVGCRDPQSVVSTPVGVFFRADAGLYLLTRSLELQSIGESVRDLLELYPVVTSAVTLPDRYQVRFTLAGETFGSGGTVVVFDYRLGTWAHWPLENGGALRWRGACVHNGTYYLLGEDGTIAYENANRYRDWLDQWVAQAIELGWVQAAGQSGWQRAYGWIPLLKRLGPFGLVAKLYSDFNETPDDTLAIAFETIETFPELPRVQPFIEVRRQECQAAKLRIETTDPGLRDAEGSTPLGFSCAGVTFEVGVKAGKVKAAAVQRI